LDGFVVTVLVAICLFPSLSRGIPAPSPRGSNFSLYDHSLMFSFELFFVNLEVFFAASLI